MNYEDVLQKLFSMNKSGMKLGLEPMQAMLAKLNNPEKNFRSIHIAGTNGKGSVSTKIAKGLEAAGYKVGLFTSPHISTFRERVQINGECISEEAMTTYFQAIGSELTFFETVTLIAFLHFSAQQVDYAVIETGIGGRKDATNCICPELSIITSIGWDHTEILGDTLEAIAYEKAGIIKAGVPVIIGPTVPKEISTSPLTQIQGPFSTYDEENSAIAACALTQLGIAKQAIDKGCSKRPPCRLEEVVSHPHPIILDVAHNPDGIRALFTSLTNLYPSQKFSAIVGLSNSKDVTGCLKVLIEHVDHLYLVQAKHRGTPVQDLAEILDRLNFSSYTPSCIQDCIHHPGPLVICGTFFIMQEARESLGLQFPSDPIQLNESIQSSIA
jgi:dihydrofolate synthase/folylpolyglutamate synthase